MRATLAWIGVLCGVVAARAEMSPGEVAILVMATSSESRQLGDYYAQARSIPRKQICSLEGEVQEVMRRDDWEERARPAIREWLAHSGLESQIRCMVTVGDVPLKVGPRSPDDPKTIQRKTHLERARLNQAQQCVGLLSAARSLMGDSSEAGKPATDAGHAGLAAAFDRLMQAVELWRREAADQNRKQFDAQFERIFLAAGGWSAMVKAMQRPGVELPEAASRQLALLQGRLQGLEQGFQSLASLPEAVARDAQMVNLAQQIGGSLGAIRWIDDQLGQLTKNETYASFDSELSMLYWPEYPLSRWQPNGLYHRYDALSGKHPTLMVSRLSASSTELVRRLIDAGIATEKTGLQGTVYLDARGMDASKTVQPGSVEQYDQSLRDLAERVKVHTGLSVVLNDDPELFQAGQCPNAALYCGWYALGKYVDAFEWQDGSVGYHMASMEAENLRDPNRNVWCNAMLRDGIAATLGPTDEPYLAAFPLPDEFFSLLLTGRYTLVEAYYRTAPFHSWVMVLVGDPLYKPFKNHPALEEDELPEHLRVQGSRLKAQKKAPARR